MNQLNPLEHPICFTSPERLTPFSAWHEHIPFAMCLVDILRPKMIVELGTHYGDSYCAFCQTVKELDLDTRCYAIDTWQGDLHANYYGPEVLADLRAHHDPLYGSFSRLIQSTFDEALQHFANGTIDLLHIDGYHTYEAVRRDCESWIPKVSPHGVVLLHDINVREHDFGVRRFWDEIKLRYPHFEFLHGHGLGVLAVGKVHSREFQALLEATNKDVVGIRDYFFQLGHRLTLKVETRAKDSALKDKANQLAEQKKAMEALRGQLQEQVDSLLQELDHVKGELEEKVNLLRTVKAESIELRQQLQERDEQERTLRKDLDEHRQQLQQAQGYIAAVQSSVGWRLLQRIRRLYLRLFPPATKRGRWFSLFLAVLRVWVNEGFKTLIKKCTTRIKWKVKYNTPVVPPSQTELPDINAQYRVWLEQHKLTPQKIDAMVKEQQEFAYKPKITIVTPVYNTDEKWLRKAIESVRSQIYPDWELCLINDASTNLQVKGILDEYSSLDNRIKVKHLEENQGISGASNHALSMATGRFIGFLDHDDELRAHALFEVVKLLNRNPEIDLIYSDEDKIEMDGQRVDPFFKPDWSPDLLLSFNYICHFVVFRKGLLEKVGGLRKEFDGAQDYDLVLRATEQTTRIAHIPEVLYSWRMVPGSAALSFDYKDYAHEAGRKAVVEALQRRGIEGTVQSLSAGRYAIRYRIRGNPLVSIIIPTKDQARLVRRCVESIEKKTGYKNYELVIIDNNSSDREALRYLEFLARKYKVLKYPDAFNYSTINNFGVRNCEGKYLLFLNNDVEVKEADWLTAMLEQAQPSKVGVVGAKLLHSDETIQHVGIILGMGADRTGHIFHSMHQRALMFHPGYIQTFTTPRNYSAVTGACMMVRRDVFEQVGGFDPSFKVAYGDIDFCLRVGELGYRIVYTPLAVLYHHECATRKAFVPLEDRACMEEKWENHIKRGEPFYNPNLELERHDFSLRVQ